MIDAVVSNQLKCLDLMTSISSPASQIKHCFTEQSSRPVQSPTVIRSMNPSELVEVFKSTYESPENLMHATQGQNQLPWVSEHDAFESLGSVTDAPLMPEKSAPDQVTLYKLNDEWHVQSHNQFQPKDVGFRTEHNPFMKKAFEKLESRLAAIASCKAKAADQTVSPDIEQLKTVLTTKLAHQPAQSERRRSISNDSLHIQIFKAVLKDLNRNSAQKDALKASLIQQKLLKEIGKDLSIQPLKGPKTEERMLGKACGVTLIEQIIQKHDELAARPEYKDLPLKLETLVFGRIEQSTRVAQSQSDSRIQAVTLLLNNKPFFMLDMGNVSSLQVTSGLDHLDYPVTLKHAETLQAAENMPVDAKSAIHVTEIGQIAGHYFIQIFDETGAQIHTQESKIFHECQTKRDMDHLFAHPEEAVRDKEFMHSLKKSWHYSAIRQFNLGYLSNGGVDSSHLCALDLSQVKGSLQVESGTRKVDQHQYLQQTSVEFHSPSFMGNARDFKNKAVFIRNSDNKLTATYFDAHGTPIFNDTLADDSNTALHIAPFFDYAQTGQRRIQKYLNTELTELSDVGESHLQSLHQQYSLVLKLEKTRQTHALFYRAAGQNTDQLKGYISTKTGQSIDCPLTGPPLQPETLDRTAVLKLLAADANLFPQALIQSGIQNSELQGAYARELIDSLVNMNNLQDDLKNAIETKYKSYREMCGMSDNGALPAAAVLDTIDKFHAMTTTSISTSRDDGFHERLQRGLDRLMSSELQGGWKEKP